MKKALLFLSLLMGVEFAQAISNEVSRRDLKLPTQQMVEKQSFVNPLASNVSTVKLSGYAGPTSAAIVTLTSFDAQPDMPRNLEITPGGNTGDIEACTIVVTGTDINNDVVSENFPFAANATGKYVGSYAFKTVTSIVWPANCESGGFAATWSVGTGEKLGVKRCMSNAGDFLFSLLNGSKEATGPTMVSNASIVASNTADFVGTMNGVNDFVLYFFQNWRCL